MGSFMPEMNCQKFYNYQKKIAVISNKLQDFSIKKRFYTLILS